MPVSDATTSAQRTRPTLDWLIVGGGVHGTHLAHVLGVARDRLRVAVIVNDSARAVKRARFMALLPYTSEHIRTAREEE